MKLRNSVAAAPQKASIPTATWHAEKQGGVWLVESEEFGNWVDTACTLEERIERLTTQLHEAHDNIRELASRVAENPHDDVEMSGHGFDVKVKRRSQFRWDSQKLEDIFAEANHLPSHVKKNLKVDRKVYERLSEAEQNELRPALDVVSQKSAINITRR